jgi:hypothetical protein
LNSHINTTTAAAAATSLNRRLVGSALPFSYMNSNIDIKRKISAESSRKLIHHHIKSIR